MIIKVSEARRFSSIWSWPPLLLRWEYIYLQQLILVTAGMLLCFRRVIALFTNRKIIMYQNSWWLWPWSQSSSSLHGLRYCHGENLVARMIMLFVKSDIMIAINILVTLLLLIKLNCTIQRCHHDHNHHPDHTGESLARSQLFIFLATLLQVKIIIRLIIVIDDKVNQEVLVFPAKEHPSPNPENYSCNATRIPDDFYVHIQKI